MSWVKWWCSKTAWTIIIAAVVAMVGAFLCAYYLACPLNLIIVIACCMPFLASLKNNSITQKLKIIKGDSA
jgi:hypothetical protein